MIRENDLQDAKRLYAFLSNCPQAETADFLLVLGCHDLRVPEHAAALYFSGAARLDCLSQLGSSGHRRRRNHRTHRLGDADLPVNCQENHSLRRVLLCGGKKKHYLGGKQYENYEL